MSQESVDVVKRIYECWSAGESVEELIDPALEYVNPPNAVEAGVKVGRRSLDAVRDIYPNFRVEPERFVDAGDEVVVIGVARGTSPSGIETQWRQGYIWTIRDGRAVRFRWFNDPGEALKAVRVDE